MKKTYKTFKQIIFLLLIAFSVAQISIAARPSNPPSSNPDLLYSSSASSQSKSGTLILKNTQSPLITQGFKFETEGSISATGLFVREVSGTEGHVYATGVITSDTLGASTGSNYVCSNSVGKLIRCP
jgi:hypothetical protein